MARYVTVASVSHRPDLPFQDQAGRLKIAEQFAVRAARMGAQIVAFPEIYIQYGVPKEAWSTHAEVVPGPTCEHMMRVAREQGIHIIWPLIERQGDLFRNSAVLIDPHGEMVGRYHKMFPTIGEMDAGVLPGAEASVFDTGWGRIGIAICFDLNFRPLVEGLVRNGAEIIFFVSMYRGGLQLQRWAQEFGRYFVSAIDAELGAIVDQSGYVLEEATYEAVITRRINLDRRMLHMDYNWPKMDAMLAKYGDAIHFDYYTREARYAISSEVAGLSVDDLICEFELEEEADYFARAMARRDQALGNQA